ncbi:MAG TPA: hypothetical protein VFS67_00305 [Polyangiaceae bacterium]|nr:hypothetical protein [Polyangiaceae bacterium]
MSADLPQAIAIGLALLACGSPPAPAAGSAPAPPAEPAAELSFDPPSEFAPRSPGAQTPVQAGSYRLRMTATCPEQERSAKGQLSLKRISAAQLPGASAGDAESNDLLLWGQTDLDVESLEACLGPRPSGSARREPIHPNVLVEVLQWNGHAQRQVLLVSSDPKAAPGRRASSGAGIAMWVDQVDRGHLAGVWCRWEVMNAGEGRWEADLVRADPPAK